MPDIELFTSKVLIRAPVGIMATVLESFALMVGVNEGNMSWTFMAFPPLVTTKTVPWGTIYSPRAKTGSPFDP